MPMQLGFIHDVLSAANVHGRSPELGALPKLSAPLPMPLPAGWISKWNYSIYEEMWGGLVGPDASDTLYDHDQCQRDSAQRRSVIS
jgi:hypothetical protein